MAKKKPEYYPQGGVHLKHAAISPHKLVTVSGSPPLTITRALPRPPESITIYGNTVDGKGVGDRTSNLFESARVISKGEITDNSSAKVTFITEEGCYGIGLFRGIMKPNTNYTVSASIEFTGSIGHAFGWRARTGDNWDEFHNYSIYSFTTDSTGDVTLNFYVGTPYTVASETLILTNIMFMEGAYTSETMPPFEPYGYRLPVTITAAEAEQRRVTAYIPSSLYSGDTYTITDFGDTSLYKGLNIVSISTEVQPPSISLSYFR